jgi:hypothetical protein
VIRRRISAIGSASSARWSGQRGAHAHVARDGRSIETAGLPPSRTIATWSDPQTGTQEIALGRGASAVLITTTVEPTTACTADGRRHDTGVPASVLTGAEHLRTPVSLRGPHQHAA